MLANLTKLIGGQVQHAAKLVDIVMVQILLVVHSVDEKLSDGSFAPQLIFYGILRALFHRLTDIKVRRVASHRLTDAQCNGFIVVLFWRVLPRRRNRFHISHRRPLRLHYLAHVDRRPDVSPHLSLHIPLHLLL